jgi:hypothetical protein
MQAYIRAFESASPGLAGAVGRGWEAS